MDTLTIFHLAIIVLFLVVFGEASLAKLVGREVPDWFRDQFAETWLGRIAPPPLMWWGIAIGELVVAGLFVAALVTGELGGADPMFLSYGLLGAMFLFAGLCFGQRVSFDFAGAASSFTYAALSGVLWYLIVVAPGTSGAG